MDKPEKIKSHSVILNFLSSFPQAQLSDAEATNNPHDDESEFLVETKLDPELVERLSSLPQAPLSDIGATNNIDDDESEFLVETKLDFQKVPSRKTSFPLSDSDLQLSDSDLQSSDSEEVLQPTRRSL